MPGGRRNAYFRATAAVATRQVTEHDSKKCYDEALQNSGAPSIRHMPLPDVPRLSVFAFESLMCLFNLLVLVTHYLNIYRTIFWLPHSHTRYVVNLYLIEPRVLVFIVVSVSRRLLWCVVRLALTSCLQHTVCKVVLPVARTACSMMPVCSQNSLQYDAGWLTTHTVFVVLTCCVWHLIYCFPTRFCDVLHRSVQHLGYWRRLSSCSSNSAPVWQSGAVYRAGAVVRYGRHVYRAEAPSNSAEPGNSAHTRLYTVFHKVYAAARHVLLLSCVVCSSYLVYLTRLYQWQQVLATSLLLAAHFGAVYILLRDYIVLRTMYQQEDMLAAQS
ncbi:hypothetical protein FHG87_015950 [Trinorchestia longiramus]|nr:hypothetical protein FHG87_015950 [Trinorchestia longiramus]